MDQPGLKEFIFDKGINSTNTSGKCGFPEPGQTPEIITILIEEPHSSGLSVAKRFSKNPAMATTPAVINAIYDAVGIRIYGLPAVRVKVKDKLVKI